MCSGHLGLMIFPLVLGIPNVHKACSVWPETWICSTFRRPPGVGGKTLRVASQTWHVLGNSRIAKIHEEPGIQKGPPHAIPRLKGVFFRPPCAWWAPEGNTSFGLTTHFRKSGVSRTTRLFGSCGFPQSMQPLARNMKCFTPLVDEAERVSGLDLHMWGTATFSRRTPYDDERQNPVVFVRKHAVLYSPAPCRRRAVEEVRVSGQQPTAMHAHSTRLRFRLKVLPSGTHAAKPGSIHECPREVPARAKQWGGGGVWEQRCRSVAWSGPPHKATMDLRRLSEALLAHAADLRRSALGSWRGVLGRLLRSEPASPPERSDEGA